MPSNILGVIQKVARYPAQYCCCAALPLNQLSEIITQWSDFKSLQKMNIYRDKQTVTVEVKVFMYYMTQDNQVQFVSVFTHTFT